MQAAIVALPRKIGLINKLFTSIFSWYFVRSFKFSAQYRGARGSINAKLAVAGHSQRD